MAVARASAFQKGADITDATSRSTQKRASGRSCIYFRDDSSSRQFERARATTRSTACLALPRQSRSEAGEISYADIEVNTAQNNFVITDDPSADGIDFQAVADAGRSLPRASHTEQVFSNPSCSRLPSRGRPHASGYATAKRSATGRRHRGRCGQPTLSPTAQRRTTSTASSGCAQTSHTKEQTRGRKLELVLLAWVIRRRGHRASSP